MSKETSNFLYKKKRNPYTQVSNVILNDKRLSWKAKGVMAYLLSKPDGWKFYITHLAEQSADGLSSVKSAIKELKEFGFLATIRHKNEKGQYIGMDWEINEDGNASSEEDSNNKYHKCGFPLMDFPPMENQPLVNTDSSNTEDSKMYSPNGEYTRTREKSPPSSSPPIKEKPAKVPKVKVRDYVELTEDEHEKLKNLWPKDWLEAMLDKLDSYKESTGKKYKSDYATLRKGGWVSEEIISKMQNKQPWTKPIEPKKEQPYVFKPKIHVSTGKHQDES